MITELTKEQEEKIEEYYQRWLAIGKDCTPLKKDYVSELIINLYAYMKLDKPSIEWVDSPKSCMVQFKKLGLDENDPKWFYGQYYASWMGYYSYFHDVFGFKAQDDDFFKLIQDIIIHTHWIIPLDTHCIISERPLFISLDAEGRLHADEKPAIKYKDDFSIWSLHGVRVSREIVETPADELDPELVIKEQNVEVRKAIVEKIGIENVISKLGAESIEKKGDVYELLNFKIANRDFCPYLKMKNPSTGSWHIEDVHPSCDTIEKALAFRNDNTGDYKEPVILT